MGVKIDSNQALAVISPLREIFLQKGPDSHLPPAHPRHRPDPEDRPDRDPDIVWEKGMFIDIYA